MKPLVTCQFSGTCLQNQKFVESVSLLWLRHGQLWKVISRVPFGFCLAYIYSFERFFSQLFNGIYDFFVTSAVIEFEEEMYKNHRNLKFSENPTRLRVEDTARDRVVGF
jgi:hypothetical protein